MYYTISHRQQCGSNHMSSSVFIPSLSTDSFLSLWTLSHHIYRINNQVNKPTYKKYALLWPQILQLHSFSLFLTAKILEKVIFNWLSLLTYLQFITPTSVISLSSKSVYWNSFQWGYRGMDSLLGNPRDFSVFLSLCTSGCAFYEITLSWILFRYSQSSFPGSSMSSFASHILNFSIHSLHVFFHSLLIILRTIVCWWFLIICLNFWLTSGLQTQIFYLLLSISSCIYQSQHIT